MGRVWNHTLPVIARYHQEAGSCNRKPGEDLDELLIQGLIHGAQHAPRIEFHNTMRHVHAVAGFISVDCGLPGTASYVDDGTKLSYAPDAAFIDTGTNYDISPDYIKEQLSRTYHNVRSFPNGTRNCYTLRSLAGNKYLVRATFKYGDYDSLNRPPAFDLYVGVNFWKTVTLVDPNVVSIVEAIVVVPDDFVQVCLVNTGTGTPFISSLDLRPLNKSLYPQANATRGLVLLGRFNFGPTDAKDIVRYPDDLHDRIWLPWINKMNWVDISTTLMVKNLDGDWFGAPSKVMQTAITPRDASKNIELSWDPKPQTKDPSPGYITILDFAELLLHSGAAHEFYVNLNGDLWYPHSFTPDYLYTDALFNTDPTKRPGQTKDFQDGYSDFGGASAPVQGYTRYNISLNATANSTLPPIINAIEVFSVIPTTEIGTDSQDVSAIAAIKAKYLVQKNWFGDPCLPKTLSWDGLTCRYGAISQPPRIIGLDLSFSGLNGNISSSFANLRAVQFLNLSHNNLIGSIPDALSQLPSLTVLDLTGNQLNESIPSGLLKRSQNGSLDLRAVPLIASEGFKGKRAVKPQNGSAGSGYMNNSLGLENRQFTYQELEMITNNFQRVLGWGGFGYVYNGSLEDGTKVAVKLRSQTSNQGVKEFLAEAQILTRIHHKNLVSMVGYCKDGEYMTLVYEFMSEGTLQEHIAGQDDDGRYLTWRQRLRIALESAQGLEYLHKSCNPPLIHRDVKATNILLNEKLEAKIADFGLSRVFNLDETHISTNTLVGIKRQCSPRRKATYSFGVVLLELITGKPAILRDPEPTSLIHWVQQRLAQGDIESIVDARMGGDHDVNTVWKSTDVALKCTAHMSKQRPTMTDVVSQLQDCLELEEGHLGDGATQNFSNSSSDDLESSYYENTHGADHSDESLAASGVGIEMRAVSIEYGTTPIFLCYNLDYHLYFHYIFYDWRPTCSAARRSCRPTTGIQDSKAQPSLPGVGLGPLEIRVGVLVKRIVTSSIRAILILVELPDYLKKLVYQTKQQKRAEAMEKQLSDLIKSVADLTTSSNAVLKTVEGIKPVVDTLAGWKPEVEASITKLGGELRDLRQQLA
ncbi:hypothetical protein EJB05_30242, partial [Eragrostis curvula]